MRFFRRLVANSRCIVVTPREESCFPGSLPVSPRGTCVPSLSQAQGKASCHPSARDVLRIAALTLRADWYFLSVTSRRVATAQFLLGFFLRENTSILWGHHYQVFSLLRSAFIAGIAVRGLSKYRMRSS